MSSQLCKIVAPTLITCGRYDQVSPVIARRLHYSIVGSKFRMFEKSAHYAMWEEREAFIRVLISFLNSIPANSQSTRRIDANVKSG